MGLDWLEILQGEFNCLRPMPSAQPTRGDRHDSDDCDGGEAMTVMSVTCVIVFWLLVGLISGGSLPHASNHYVGECFFRPVSLPETL